MHSLWVSLDPASVGVDRLQMRWRQQDLSAAPWIAVKRVASRFPNPTWSSWSQQQPGAADACAGQS